MTSDIPEIQPTQEFEEVKVEKTINEGVGIVGDNTDHTLVMTRLWVTDEKVEKIEIHVIGSELLVARGINIAGHLKGKMLKEVELITDYHLAGRKDVENYPLDVIYTSIIRALDDFHNPVKSEFPEEESEPHQPDSTISNIDESSETQRNKEQNTSE